MRGRLFSDSVAIQDFIASILEADPKARIITAGDFNEFTQVRPIQRFMERSSMLELDEVAGIPEEKRYTYLYDNNCQQLDVSPPFASYTLIGTDSSGSTCLSARASGKAPSLSICI